MQERVDGRLANAGHHGYESTQESDYETLKTCRRVLALGDGTVGKVGRELIDSGMPLGVLPLGTANNLAGSLGFTYRPKKSLRASNAGRNERLISALREGCGQARF
jgi:diacylglycerol kinase family enzyme